MPLFEVETDAHKSAAEMDFRFICEKFLCVWGEESLFLCAHTNFTQISQFHKQSVAC